MGYRWMSVRISWKKCNYIYLSITHGLISLKISVSILKKKHYNLNYYYCKYFKSKNSSLISHRACFEWWVQAEDFKVLERPLEADWGRGGWTAHTAINSVLLRFQIQKIYVCRAQIMKLEHFFSSDEYLIKA